MRKSCKVGSIGCAAGEHTFSRKLVEGKSYKLKSAKVVWVDNTALEIKITALGNVTVDKEYARAKTELANSLLSEFRRSAPKRLAEKLGAIGIGEGNDATIYMGPESASASLGRGVMMRVYIKDKNNKSVIWQVTIGRGGPAWGITDSEVVDNFIGDALHELKLAGWIN